MSGKDLGFKQMLNDRFGMFVHYGIYSEMAGEFNGKECTGLGEWIQYHLQIPNAEYEAFGREHFHPSPDFAKNIVKKAKEIGVKYIVLTSKHHDGFCLFKSEYTKYSTYEFFGRDLCKELADECKKEGIELGLYYSHTLDWYEKDAGGNFHSVAWTPVKRRNSWDFPDDNINFEKYLYEKCFPQVREILTNYGDLKLIWFDFPHDIKKEQSKELRDLVKSIQPNCQINSRIGHDCNDYESLGDNVLPTAPVDSNLECLITLNDTWGYKRNDNNWKSAEDVIGIFCKTLGSDASLLLNVGPLGDGNLNAETVDILDKMGEWTKRNSEAIYNGVKGNPFSMTFSWGSVATKGNALYLYVKDKTHKDLKVVVGENNSIKSVSVLGTDEKPVYSYNGKMISIEQIDTDFIVPVYKIEFENDPVFEKNIVQTGNLISLGVLWASKVTKGNENGVAEPLVYEKSEYSDEYGKRGLCVHKVCISDFWDNSDEIACWDAYFEEAGEYEAILVNTGIRIHEEEEKVGVDVCGFFLTIGDTTNPINMNEEKSRFAISKTLGFNTRICHDGGKFKIEKPGKYRVLLSRTENGNEVHFFNVDFMKVK